MSGALNSVMGGGGSSSLLGDIGGIIGGAEFGPIGAMIGQALGNMLQQAIQNGVGQATQQLQQQGMPSYVAGMVNDQAAAQTAQNTNPNVPADVQQQAQDQYGAEFDDLSNQLGAFIVKSALNHKAASSGGSGAAGSAGGTSSGGGWLQAIASAMGDALGEQAGQLVKLSNTLSSEVATQNTATDSSGNPTAQAEQQNEAAARQFNKDMTSFQAQSQQYSILQNTFTNALQSLGSALQGMARKS